MTAPARAAARAKAPKEARTYTITELAQEFDITPRAIRFYEDVGLLEPARSGRNRIYSLRERTRLKLTLRGKRLGLSLQEIKQLVDMYDSPSDTAPQLQAFLGVLGEHRLVLEQQLEDIRVTLEEITQHEERCRRLLAEAQGGPAATADAPRDKAKASRAPRAPRAGTGSTSATPAADEA